MTKSLICVFLLFPMFGCHTSDNAGAVNKYLLSRDDNTSISIFSEDNKVYTSRLCNSNIFTWDDTCYITSQSDNVYEGENCYDLSINSGKSWWGFGFHAHFNDNFNIFSDGFLCFSIKTLSESIVKIGIESGSKAAWIVLTSGLYGYKNNGKWNKITIPVSDLVKAEPELNLSQISTYFMMASADKKDNQNIFLDDIKYISKDTIPLKIHNSKYDKLKDVKISGRQLLVNNQPFHIRGVCWNPTPKGAYAYPDYTYYAPIDIPLIKAAGFNVVRTYYGDVTKMSTEVLDQLYEAGIYVILTVYMTWDDNYHRESVACFMNHPAILMWLIGNEWNVNFLYNDSKKIDQCVDKLNRVVSEIKEIDPCHPVGTTTVLWPDKSLYDVPRQLAFPIPAN